MSFVVGTRLALASLAVAAGVFEARGERRGGTAAAASAPVASSAAETHNVILVVSDGMRWQELFRGADSSLLFQRGWLKREYPAQVREKFWRPTVEERRSALMPFMWSTIAGQGALVGNRDAGSRMRVSNGLNFSYPGYNETLTGYADPKIRTNRFGANHNVTVFEWLNRQDAFRGRVAAVGAWDAFQDIFNRRRSGIAMHTARREPLDERSHAAAMSFLRDARPAALFIAYVETDDHSHDGRYDRVLEAVNRVDRFLGELWQFAQSHPQYRDRTTLILTTDHGRGRRNWKSHGEDVAGAEETFVAMIGPAVPAAGVVNGGNVFINAQIAATVAASVGHSFAGEPSRAAPPIEIPAPAVIR